jgi:hypothetical protein
LNISSFNIIEAGQTALHVCRIIITYTAWEAMKAMEQALLTITEANRKGNLKTGGLISCSLSPPTHRPES